MICASGAANERDNAGCVHWLKASFFVGVRKQDAKFKCVVSGTPQR